jgi:very-short-patch-repair endonuclease
MVDREWLEARAKQMRREPTLPEKRLWKLLRDRRLGGLKFRRQVSIAPYIADFLCFSPRLIVEADGASHYDAEYDAARDAFFIYEQKYKVLRFKNQMILHEPQQVLDAILREVGRG